MNGMRLEGKSDVTVERKEDIQQKSADRHHSGKVLRFFYKLDTAYPASQGLTVHHANWVKKNKRTGLQKGPDVPDFPSRHASSTSTTYPCLAHSSPPHATSRWRPPPLAHPGCLTSPSSTRNGQPRHRLRPKINAQRDPLPPPLLPRRTSVQEA
jgi:hypothetical protein